MGETVEHVKLPGDMGIPSKSAPEVALQVFSRWPTFSQLPVMNLSVIGTFGAMK